MKKAISVNLRCLFLHENTKIIGLGGAAQLLFNDISGVASGINAHLELFNLIFALINQAGINIGIGGSILAHDAAAILSTLNINPQDFFAQNYSFDNADGQVGSIVNRGSVNVDKFVAFIGEMIENHGAVIARLGQVAFGAGEKVTLSVDGEGLVNVVVDEALSDELAGQIDNSKSQITNSGTVDADGGAV
jgi:hypothetical protein